MSLISRVAHAAQLMACGLAISLASPVFSTSVFAQGEAPHMFGVNLAGAEFGGSGGTYGYDYIYPNAAELDYYHSKGQNLIRLPFRWERLQPTLNAPLNAAELGRIANVVNMIEARGMMVILDMHNYDRRKVGSTTYLIGSATVPNSAFADAWIRIANEFKDSPALYGYGIMNEPHGTGGTWPVTAQVCVDGIRTVDTENWIIVAGENWSAARTWPTSNPNLDIQDASDKIMYEAHCYFDGNNDGSYGTYDAEGMYPDRGWTLARPFVEWLKQKGARGFIGEYGVPGDDPRWNEVLDLFMAYINANGISGTYWAGGPWWGSYPLSCEPTSNFTVDKPQMAVLEKYQLGQGEATSLILDNTSSTGVTVAGTWITSKASSGYYGANYLHDNNSGKGAGKYVLYTPNLLSTGSYEVFVRWSASGNRATNVPIDIVHRNGTELMQVNQRTNGGTWVSMGTYPFLGGPSGGGSVKIGTLGTNGYVIADSVRFVPAAPVEIIVDNTDSTGVTVAGTWTPSTANGGYVGANYFTDGNTGKGASKFVRYTPMLPKSGMYRVLARWTSGSNRASNVPIDIIHADGSDALELDQRTSGGKWIHLGNYYFTAGSAGNVTLGTLNTNGYVIADAFYFAQF